MTDTKPKASRGDKSQEERYGNPEDAAGRAEDHVGVDRDAEVMDAYDRNLDAAQKAEEIQGGKHSDEERRKNVERGLAPEGPNNEQVKQGIYRETGDDLTGHQLADKVSMALATFNNIPLNAGQRDFDSDNLDEVATQLEDAAKAVRHHMKGVDKK